MGLTSSCKTSVALQEQHATRREGGITLRLSLITKWEQTIARPLRQLTQACLAVGTATVLSRLARSFATAAAEVSRT